MLQRKKKTKGDKLPVSGKLKRNNSYSIYNADGHTASGAIKKHNTQMRKQTIPASRISSFTQVEQSVKMSQCIFILKSKIIC